MSGTFVPVDLDQVLDEFEEKEGSSNGHDEQESHLGQATPETFPGSEEDVNRIVLTDDSGAEDTNDLGVQQFVEENESLNEQIGSPVNSNDDSTGENNLLDADPFHRGIRRYSEDDSDCSNDSVSISDVIAAAEAITEVHHKQPDNKEQHTDLNSDSEKDSDVIIAAVVQANTEIDHEQPENREQHTDMNIDLGKDSDAVAGAVQANSEISHKQPENQEQHPDLNSNLEKGSDASEENMSIKNANRDVNSAEHEIGSLVGIHDRVDHENTKCGPESVQDVVTVTQGASETECTSKTDLRIGSDDREWLSSDVVDTPGGTVSSARCLSTAVDCSSGGTLDMVKPEASQSVDHSQSDACVGQHRDELRNTDTARDQTQPDSKSDQLNDLKNNSNVHECVGCESNGASVSSNIDATTDDINPTPNVSCISEAEGNSQQISPHNDEGRLTEHLPDLSATWESHCTPDNYLTEQNEEAMNITEGLSYPEHLMASIVHNQSDMDSSNSEGFFAATEGASADVIDVDVEAVPLSEDTRTQVRHVGFILPPSAVSQEATPIARRFSSGESGLGSVPPIWVPDAVASHCMNCGLKFGVIKRKHHCRACGKVLCSSCCNMKFSLMYLDGKEGRVCQVCCNALLRAQTVSQVTEQLHNLPSLSEVEEQNEQDAGPPMEPSGIEVQEPSNPAECLEGIDVVQADNEEPELDRHSSRLLPPPLSEVLLQPTDAPSLPTPTSPAISEDSDCLFRLDVDHVRSLMPQEKKVLPPVINAVGGSSRSKDKAILVTENPDDAEVMYKLKGLGETVVFLVNKSLVVKVKIIKLNCCVKKKCWCFVTEGMGGANQEEMVILLECLRKESTIPGDIFSHFNTAFTYAKEGHTVSNLGYTIFGQPFLGSMDNAGFLYIKPTFQCLENIPVPSTPYVFGILIQRPETPWAQLFPLRLMLRLGAEFRYYPCPLWSVRNRAPIYGQIGQTILNLLVDFKNFQYTLPPVTGLLVHMEEQQTKLLLPQDRYDEIVKVLNSTDDHVMALGATFSRQADSHLVCMQDDTGYKTQAINIQNFPRKVTGASFIVFTGALKASSPFSAKVNIVEDGILVQLTPEAILELRQALREMRDHSIKIGIPGRHTEEMVFLEWVTRVDHTHSGVCSEIDGLSLEGFPFITMHSGADFTRCSNLRIQCSDVFFMNSGAKPSQFKTDKKLNKMLGDLSKAGCKALKQHLVMLSQQSMNKIGLRVNMDADSVGYNVGSNQQTLPPDLMADLDNEMVPAVNNAATRYRTGPLVMELVFRILKLF